MNIAYLIAAHTDPQQLRKLVLALNNGKNDFYIHIDKKTNQSKFEELLLDISSVKFVSKRVKVCWGGVSQIKAIVSLLDEAMAHKYDRIVYISGLDYPVWSNEKIEQFYEKNPRKQLICGYNLTDCNDDVATKKISRMAYWDITIKNEKVSNKVRKKLNDFLAYIPHAKTLKIGKEEWDIYRGSSWWSLDYNCAKYVAETYHKYKQIYNYFKFTFTSDELWVQTILANSKYKDEMMYTDKHDFNEVTVLELVNYTTSMYIWQEKDYNRIINSGKMFIRKVTTEISAGLCEKLDEYRKNGN